MNVLSLFAGIGGLDLGLERAGMSVVGQVEIDPFCRRVLAKHWPGVPRHDDVRTCVEWWLGELRPAVDVVCGGFPCQPVSLAGLGRAQADERWLWPATWAVIRDLRPQFAIMENVPGLLGRGMGDVLGDLAAGGYDAEWDCVPAAAVGAPHRRDRVFVVAYASGPGLEGAGLRGRPAGHRAAVADTGSDRREGRPELPPRRRPLPGGGPLRADPDGRGDAVADPDSIGRDRRRRPMVGDPGNLDHRRPRARWDTPTGNPWWASEPDVGRVAHGVPARVDRLRALGNAVVPQVAEHIGRLVMGAAS